MGKVLQLESIGTLLCLIFVFTSFFLSFCLSSFKCPMSLSYTDDLPSSAAPSEPINFNLLPNTSSSLSASWEVPARPNGIIVGYTISCTTPPTTAMPITFSVPGSVLSHLLMGLKPFTNYTCEVRANTSAGVGDSSNTETERTDEDGRDF